MLSSSRSRVLSTGLAMFSMFFGAGNVIFPLVIGQLAGHQTPYAILGLLLTAVGVPFLGLIAILLFKGDYREFFGRLGAIPGFILAAAIMFLIGPFGGLPRCIALSYSTLKISLPFLSFNGFSLIACLLIFSFTFRKSQLIRVLGNYLTPLLLVSLVLIVIKGLWTANVLTPSSLSPTQAFNQGLLEGYNTMDLLASFFFSAIIYNQLKQEFKANTQQLLAFSLKASAIGGTLLSLIYIGFSSIAAYHAPLLQSVPQGEILATLTLNILGPYAGLIASTTIALACLTTAIALTTAFAEFLQHSLSRGFFSYHQALILTLVASYAVSLLEFTGIVQLLAPLLQVIYPALIMFTVVNIILKWREMKHLPVKEMNS